MLEAISPNLYLACFVMLTLSSVFPISALAYQIFQRDKRYQELMEDFDLLGIKQSTKKLEDKYNRPAYIVLLSSVAHFILPVLLTVLGTFMIFLGLLISLPDPQDFPNWLVPHQTVILALGYGFLGAYLFSIQLIYRRYTTVDLPPSVYMLCTLTLISGFVFNYIAFSIISRLTDSNRPSGVEAAIFAIVAFSLGYFPTLAIRWFNQIANSALGINQQQTNSLPLSVIDGISQFHETRLRDEGIDNVQNLASVKIDDLLLNTRFNAQQVLEWIDQAILHTYIDSGTIQSFRRGGVRKVSDFQDLWRPYQNKETVDDSARQARAQQLQSTPDHLDALYTATLTGPNMAYIENYWTNVKKPIQEKQQKKIEDLLEDRDRKEEAARTEIFKLISQAAFDGHSRETLGEIARQLTSDPEDVASNYQEHTEPEILTGLAWWLGWLTIQTDNDYELDEQACQYYLKAINDKPEVRYKLAKLYYQLVNYYIDQKKDNKRALKLADSVLQFSEQNVDESELTIILKTISALIYIKTNKKNDAVKLINEAKEMIENFPDDEAPVEHSEILQEIWGKLQKVPGRPEEIAEILEEIEARSNTDSVDENSTDEKNAIRSHNDKPASS
jgi:hypothetical protein